MSKDCSKLDESGTALRPDGTYPGKLNKIINLFETLPEDERRETLVKPTKLGVKGPAGAPRFDEEPFFWFFTVRDRLRRPSLPLRRMLPAGVP